MKKRITVWMLVLIFVLVLLSMSLFSETSAASRPPVRPTPDLTKLPTPLPTATALPTPKGTPQVYTSFIWYPWQYGEVCGRLLRPETNEPVYAVAGLAKVFCTEDGVYCAWLWDEAWSPRSWTKPDTGEFCVDTHVAYAPGVWDEPIDGGVGDFVIFATTNGSFITGEWERVNYKITVYPNEVSDAGDLYTIIATVPVPENNIQAPMEFIEGQITGGLDG